MIEIIRIMIIMIMIMIIISEKYGIFKQLHQLVIFVQYFSINKFRLKVFSPLCLAEFPFFKTVNNAQ